MLWHKTIGTGADLVLLHGWGFSADIFDSFVIRYKNHYRITLIEIPGHGRSEDVKGGIDEWCSAINELIPKNSTLIGSSLGGLLAIKIASLFTIKNLVLVGASPSFTNHENWQYGMSAETFTRFFDDLKNNYSKTLRRFISLQTKNKNLIRELFNIIEKHPTSRNALEQGLNILLKNDLQEVFKSLDIPKYAILGTLDMLVPKSIENWYIVNNTTTKLLRTGHLPFLEDDFLLPDNL